MERSEVVKGWIAALLGMLLPVLVLNLVLTLPESYVAFPRRFPFLILQPEALGMAALALVAAWVLPRRQRAAFRALAALAIVLCLLKAADQAMLTYFYRNVDVYDDSLHLKALYHLLAGSGLLLVSAGVIVGFLLGGAVAVWGLGRLFARAAAVTAPLRPALKVAVALAFAIATGGVFEAFRRAEAQSSLMILARQVERVATMAAIERNFGARIDALAAERRAILASGEPLAKLGGRDVVVFLIEAYGEAAFGRPDYWQELAPDARRFEETVGGAGYKVLSRYLESPVYGGNSWIADASFSCGIEVRYQRIYDRLLATSLPCLPAILGARGYETVAVRPGTTMDWPEGDFYRFDKQYALPDLGYEGPKFFWSPAPDQYAVAWLAKVALKERRAKPDAPVLAYYQLTSSHAPYNSVPTLIEDWDELLRSKGKVYWEAPSYQYAHTFRDVFHGHEGYVRSVRYEWDVIAAAVKDLIERDTLVIVVGDHQPLPHLIGHRTYDVPIHVLTKDDALARSFARLGFAPGFVPPKGKADKKLWDFLHDFLRETGNTAH